MGFAVTGDEQMHEAGAPEGVDANAKSHIVSATQAPSC